MHSPLYDRLAKGLTRPRELPAQTARQLDENPRFAALDPTELFRDPDGHLQDYEVETLFGPLVAVTLQERADVSPLLLEEPVDGAARARLVEELTRADLKKIVSLPDGSTRTLTLTEPLVDRYLKLLRVDVALLPDVTALLYEGLPGHLASVAHALCRERNLNSPQRQRVFGRLVVFAAVGRLLGPEDVVTMADFVAAQSDLGSEVLLEAAEQAVRLAKEALDKAKLGRAYLSQSVAEHHQMHGSGEVDEHLVTQRHEMWERLLRLHTDLREWVDEGCP